MRNVSGSFGFRSLIFIAAFGICCASFAEEWKLTASGYGPIKPGTSLKKAENLMSVRLRTSKNRPLDFDCDFVYPEKGHKGISLMIENNKVTHIQVSKKGISTDAGIEVGDLASKVRKIYGRRLKIEPHHYTNGFYYFVWEDKRGSGIKYEIEAGRVVTIYGGGPTISRVEGCS